MIQYKKDRFNKLIWQLTNKMKMTTQNQTKAMIIIQATIIEMTLKISEILKVQIMKPYKKGINLNKLEKQKLQQKKKKMC